MATTRIREFLDGSGAQYVIITHSPAFSAQQAAASTHIPGRFMAKTVLVKLDGKLAMAVVAAPKDVNLEALRLQSGAQEAMLAEEADFFDRFRGCQLGTVPPFGNLFGVQTYFDRDLLRRHQIAFAAGTHTHVIAMKTADYVQLVKPTLVRISVAPITGGVTPVLVA